jgi:DNA-binding transcriptional MerR regulator
MALFLKDLGLSNNEIIEALMEVVPQELIDDNTGEILTGQFHQRMAEVNAPMITPWRRERNRIYLEN